MASILKVDTIQDQSGNNIINESGDTITIGASGDTITVPTGATFSAPGIANTPAFSVYRNGNQSISSSTWTKVEFNTVNFDTDSDYDNVTNYRFTPQVAGKYQFNININFDGTSVTFCAIRIYKNGSSAFTTFHINNTNTGIRGGGSVILEANGTTDYFEGYGYLIATSPIFASGTDTVFSGFKLIE